MRSENAVFDAIIFDMDGVIVDTRATVEKVWFEWAEENKLDWEVVKNNIHGKRTVEIVRQFAPELDQESTVKTIEDKQAQDIDNTCLEDGAIECLAKVKDCKWAIVTSNTRAAALNKLANVQFNVPEVLITGDDVKNGKPSPDGYLLAAARLGVNPGKCIVVEDSPAGVMAGKSAKMCVAAVETTHQAIFLRDADIIVNSLNDLRILCSDSQDGKKISIVNVL